MTSRLNAAAEGARIGSKAFVEIGEKIGREVSVPIGAITGGAIALVTRPENVGAVAARFESALGRSEHSATARRDASDDYAPDPPSDRGSAR